MKKIILFVLVLSSINTQAQISDFLLYQKAVYIHGVDTLPYRILLPLNYDKSKIYPLVVFLHGSGERGNNNEAQLVHGGSLFLESNIRVNYPAFVVFPQCPANSSWSNLKTITKNDSTTLIFSADGKPTSTMKSLIGLLSELKHDYKIDKHSVYVGGLSMGGMGTFELVRRKPKIFAAAFAICGGADTTTARIMKHTAWWIFHGLKDNVVNPQFSINMAKALKNAGAEVILNLYPNDSHNSWDDALAEKNLLPWLFFHHN